MLAGLFLFAFPGLFIHVQDVLHQEDVIFADFVVLQKLDVRRWQEEFAGISSTGCRYVFFVSPDGEWQVAHTPGRMAAVEVVFCLALACRQFAVVFFCVFQLPY